MNKKALLSFILACMIFISSVTFASAKESDTSYVFTFPNGKNIFYFLDEYGNPYVLDKNGEEIPIALPLDNLKVTDAEKIEQLNAELSTNNSRSAPSSYVELTAATPSQNSTKYTQVMSFLSTTSLPTRYIKFYPNHEGLSIKTADVYKEHWYSSVNINFTWYYYTEYLDSWYSRTFTNQNCTNSAGKRIQHEPSINPYGKFEMSKGSSGVESFVLEIWSTYAW